MSKLVINNKNMDLIKNLVMYAENNAMFFKQISDFLYEQGAALDAKTETLYCKNLHDLKMYFNEILKKY